MAEPKKIDGKNGAYRMYVCRFCGVRAVLSRGEWVCPSCGLVIDVDYSYQGQHTGSEAIGRVKAGGGSGGGYDLSDYDVVYAVCMDIVGSRDVCSYIASVAMRHTALWRGRLAETAAYIFVASYCISRGDSGCISKIRKRNILTEARSLAKILFP